MTEELDGTLIVPRFAPRIHPTPIPALGVFDEPLVCLSVNRFWVSHVLGVLEALDQPDTWIGTALEVEAARQNVRELMLALAEGNCVPNTFDVRQNEAEPCILEKTDDGMIWVPFAMLDLCAAPVKPDTVKYPDDMRIDPVTGDLQYSLDGTTWYDYPATNTPEPTGPYTPPRIVPAGATDEEKRCAAASSAANALNQMYEQTYGAIAAGIANSWGAFSNFMNDVTDFVFGITYGQVWDIVKLIGLWEAIDFETNYAAATLGTEAIEALTCLIYDNTTIDQNGHSQVDFGAVRDNVISELGVNPGTAVWTHLNYLQASGLERIADVGFGSTDCSFCVDQSPIPLYVPTIEGGTWGLNLTDLGDGWWSIDSEQGFSRGWASVTSGTNGNPSACTPFKILDWEWIVLPKNGQFSTFYWSCPPASRNPLWSANTVGTMPTAYIGTFKIETPSFANYPGFKLKFRIGL